MVRPERINVAAPIQTLRPIVIGLPTSNALERNDELRKWSAVRGVDAGTDFRDGAYPPIADNQSGHLGPPWGKGLPGAHVMPNKQDTRKRKKRAFARFIVVHRCQ